jgi:hypothetical protein
MKLKEQMRFYLFIILTLFIHLVAFAQDGTTVI